MFYEHLLNHLVIYLHLIALWYEYNRDDLNSLAQEKHWKRCRTNVNLVLSNEFREVELPSWQIWKADVSTFSFSLMFLPPIDAAPKFLWKVELC